MSATTKRKQPFVLEFFLSTQTGEDVKRNIERMKESSAREISADAVFYIMAGKCKVTVVSEKGKEAVVALHEKGDFFGEGCLSGQPRRSCDGDRDYRVRNNAAR